MLISHKGHTDNIQVYSVTVMTHVKALQAGHSSQGTSEPITPAPRLIRVEVLEETRTNKITVEECTYGNLDKHETTKLNVSTELVDLSQKLITRGFLELAEEARIVDVRQTPSVCMTEVIPQITEITKPMCNCISWKVEEDMEQSVEPLCDVAMEVPTVRFDVGQLMQWPDMNSAGVICEFMLESEMFSHGPTRRKAEPVFVTAESEMFTPVFAGGSSWRRAPWSWRRQLHREFLPCRWSEAISRLVCLRPLARKTGGV